MSSSDQYMDTSVSVPLKVLETIESLCRTTGCDLDRKTITLVINLIKAGIDPESITDLIIELKNKSLMGAR